MKDEKFLWGNSVSSMQTEGAFDEDGKGLSVYDIKKSTANSSDWKVAIDEYHKFNEDFDLMSNIGMNCYRFQISWSRIIPDGDGEINEEGLEYYDQYIDGLLKRGIVPVICLYHFDMPLKLANKYNGFASSHVTEAFVRFSKIVIDHFFDKVKYWLVFNEQNCTMFEEGFANSGYITGERTIENQYIIATNSLIAYAQVADYIHKFKGLQIGGMVAYQKMYPASAKPEDVAATRKAEEFINNDFLKFFTTGKRSSEVVCYMNNNGLEKIESTLVNAIDNLTNIKSDFLAFSYYYSLVIDSENIPKETAPNYFMSKGKVSNEYLKTSEYGWQIDPLGFRTTITEMYNRYNLPIFPVENGIGAKENWNGKDIIQDDYRIEYHKEHIQAMEDSINIDGAKVMGYLGWGLIDIPSSTGNMEKRYGLVYVNRGNHDLRDLRRVPKKSYYWFKHVIQTNGKELGDKDD
ncbi:glycoside hydrolase family 1 protein [Companilactobacillus allii]|uniref:6-phospho-beta-glucosidase n=1 Tax=Companilactobacillus allii TaxID=1847728 RepID=A0A1P8Q104_9LACO|nr:glycoside hydrolase family 1 protein [Companilactobacillus allii]APX71516.1 6-phospho-beta-glucosidase [Companilactobacillus allii]USQ68598.1 glycoside hydrolase family 1 protein [Companilactobacillus allii]